MKLRANAKINLTLDVCSKREDGYHIIDSVMQSVSLCDMVTLEKAEGITVRCSAGEISGETNTAHMAAKAFFEYTGIIGGADIFIEKNIPLSAGLGGGSADAAAVINGLDLLYSTGLSEAERCKIGLEVGADVPFCVMGGTVRVGGIGEELKKISDLPECFFVIVKEGQKGSTAEMYRRLDGETHPHPDTCAAVAAIEKGELSELIKNIGNSFAAVNDYSVPKILLEATAPLCIALSGSGPSVFAIYADSDSAVKAEKQLKEKGICAYFAKPRKNGTETV